MVTELEPGMSVGRYRLIRRLAQGGMGAVWVARDQRLERDVAVKVLPRLLVTDPSAERRFEREARAMGRLQHPNVVAIFDVGTADPGTGEELPFLVMELIEGRSLSDILGDGPLPPRRAARIMAEVARALAAAHHAGIVHRDLKPSNVMVMSDGHVKVLDFGLARILATDRGQRPEDTLTTPGMVLGSCPYMAPEQALGQAVSSASDVFSCGAVLYEALSGRRAFDGSTPMRVLQAVVKCEYPPLEQLAPEVPQDLQRIVRRCLDREPDRRYQEAAALADDIEAFLEALRDPALEAPTVRVDSAAGRAALRRRRRAAVLVSAAGLAVAAVVLAAGWVLGRRGQEPLRPDPGRWRATELARTAGRVWSPDWDPTGTRLVAHRSQRGSADVILVDVESGEVRSLFDLAEAGTEVGHPRFSPDGRAVALHAVAGSSSRCLVVPATGGDPVHEVADCWHPEWWGDDTLVFARHREGPTSDLWRRRLTGGAEERLLEGTPELGWWKVLPRPGGGLAAMAGPSPVRLGVFVVDPDLGSQSRWRSATGSFYGASWAPGGRSLVVSFDRRLERVSATAAAPLLPSTGKLMYPRFSPDGRRLATAAELSSNDLVAVDPDGGGWSCLLCGVADSGWGSVAGDGSIVYRREEGGVASLFVIEPSGTQRRLTDLGEDGACPTFDPAGRRVAYLSRGEDGHTRLRIRSRDGGDPITVADGAEPSEYPAWSPDGRSLAFAGGDPLRVRVVSSAGGAPREVSQAGGDYPVWSPDGRLLAYSVWTEDADPEQGAWVVPVAGGEPRRVGSEPTRLAFSPDGRFLLQLRRSAEGLELWQASTDTWQWQRRALLDLGSSLAFQLEYLPFTLDPQSGRLVLNRRRSAGALLVFDGIDPRRW